MARVNIRAREVVAFLCAGGLAALVNLAAGAGARQLVAGPWAYEVRLVAGFSAGTVVSFVLNRQITFAEQRGKLLRQAARYLLTALVSIGVASAAGWMALFVLSLLFQSVLSESHRELLAHVAAIGVTTIYNFFTIKYFALRADEVPHA